MTTNISKSKLVFIKSLIYAAILVAIVALIETVVKLTATGTVGYKILSLFLCGGAIFGIVKFIQHEIQYFKERKKLSL